MPESIKVGAMVVLCSLYSSRCVSFGFLINHSESINFFLAH